LLGILGTFGIVGIFVTTEVEGDAIIEREEVLGLAAVGNALDLDEFFGEMADTICLYEIEGL
jgi:hypothetical protein